MGVVDIIIFILRFNELRQFREISSCKRHRTRTSVHKLIKQLPTTG